MPLIKRLKRLAGRDYTDPDRDRRQRRAQIIAAAQNVFDKAKRFRDSLQSLASKLLKELGGNPAILATFATVIGGTAAALGIVATVEARRAQADVDRITLPTVEPPQDLGIDRIQAAVDRLDATVDSLRVEVAGTTTTAPPVPTTTSSDLATFPTLGTIRPTTTTTPTPTEPVSTSQAATTSEQTTTTVDPVPAQLDAIATDLDTIRADLAALDADTATTADVTDLATRIATVATDLAAVTDQVAAELAATATEAGDAAQAAAEAHTAALDAANRADQAQAKADNATQAGATHGATETQTRETWVDGKPIWRRSFTLTATTGQTTTIDTTLTTGTVASVVSIVATGLPSFSTNRIQLPYYDGTRQLHARIGPGGVQIFASGATLSNVVVVVSYTKP